MYSSARSSCSVWGSGTAALTGTTIPGVVPQVTIGLMAAASTTISRSKLAPGSVCSLRQASGISEGPAGLESTH